MARVQKAGADARMLLERGASFQRANELVEGIHRETGMSPDTKRMTLQGDRVPKETIEWMLSLSDEEITRVRIATNRTLDCIIVQDKTWPAFKSARHLLSNTIIAFPEAGKPMPKRLMWSEELDPFEDTRHILDTSQFAGMDAAIVFDDWYIERASAGRIKDDYIYRPRGEVVVLKDFPKASRIYSNKDDPDVICPRGERRFISRFTSEAWFGPIVRSPYKIRMVNDAIARPFEQEGNKTDKMSIYTGYSLENAVFGVLVELAPKKNAEKPVQKPKPRPDMPGAEKLVLDAVAEKAKFLAIEATRFFILNPDKIEDQSFSGKELAGPLFDIAKNQPVLQDALREEIRTSVFWTYLQTHPRYTIMEFAKTFYRVCDALGIPEKR